MVTAIRKHLRDFIAVAVLLVVAMGVSYYILQEQRLRIPVLEEKPFELKAEFQTAQAVVPGQGQTIRVAGVRVGDVAQVELEGGRAIVTFGIDRKYLPVYKDATILLRPTTGLKDMFFQLDPGTRSAGEYAEGEVVQMSNTAPDVNLDEILAALDGDTQAYLRLLIVGAGNGLKGRDKELGELLGSLGPINRSLAKLNSKVAQRRKSLSNFISNFSELTKEVGEQDDALARLIDSSNTALGAIGEQDPDVQEAIRVLPGALAQTRRTLEVADDFGRELGPTFNALRPFARNLPELNSSTRRLADRVTPVIRDEIRPFVRAAREPIPDLKVAAQRFSRTTPKLTAIGRKINTLGNMAALNPRGAEEPCEVNEPATCDRDEGYLYWAAWLAHNGVSTFGGQDANSLYRKIYFTASCANIAAFLGASPAKAIITGLAPLFAAGGACNTGT